MTQQNKVAGIDYKQIEFRAGESVESAVKKLKSYNEPVCGLFNGKMLYSDENVDDAYKKVTGKTKTEFDKEMQEEHLQREKEEREHKEAIPKLTVEYIEKAEKILDKKYLLDWAKCVPTRLNDLYRGMELDACLEIIEKLNKGCDLKVAKDIIDNQGHSGMSYGLVRLMVQNFCDRGEEFAKYVK